MRVFILLCSVLSWCAAVDLAALIGGPPKLWMQTIQPRLVQAWEQQTVAVLEAVAPEGGPVGGEEARLMVRVGCNLRAGVPTPLHLEEAQVLADRLWSDHGEELDPLVLASAFLVVEALDRPWWLKNRWCDRARNAWEAWDGKGIQRDDTLLRSVLDIYCLGTWGTPKPDSQGDKTGANISRFLGKHLAAALQAQLDPVAIFPVIRSLSIRRPHWGDIIATALEEALQGSAYPSWVQDAMRGGLHIQLAWAARGSGWANTVTEAGWKGFREHLALADAVLERAIADPACDHPQVAAWGITVAGAGAASRSLVQWFRSGVRLCADYPSLYSQFNSFSLPRWGGDLKRILQLGRDADVLAQGMGSEVDTHPLAFRRALAVRAVVDDLISTKQLDQVKAFIDDQELARCQELLQEEARRWPDQRAAQDELLAALYWHRGQTAEACAVYADLVAAQGSAVLLTRYQQDTSRLGVPLDAVLPADLVAERARRKAEQEAKRAAEAAAKAEAEKPLPEVPVEF